MAVIQECMMYCHTAVVLCGVSGSEMNIMSLQGSLATTLREVRPTSFLGVPRVWEKMHEAMKDIGAKSSLMKKTIANWAKGIGLKASYNAMSKYVLAQIITL